MERLERTTCPSCGGAGGGPMGRAGSAWDNEDYVCPRCEGEGMIVISDDVLSTRPGLVKAAREAAEEMLAAKPERKAAG